MLLAMCSPLAALHVMGKKAVDLNVGGFHYQTWVDTLLRHPSPVIADLLRTGAAGWLDSWVGRGRGVGTGPVGSGDGLMVARDVRPLGRGRVCRLRRVLSLLGPLL